jgi:hypothetical protein
LFQAEDPFSRGQPVLEKVLHLIYTDNTDQEKDRVVARDPVIGKGKSLTLINTENVDQESTGTNKLEDRMKVEIRSCPT